MPHDYAISNYFESRYKWSSPVVTKQANPALVQSDVRHQQRYFVKCLTLTICPAEDICRSNHERFILGTSTVMSLGADYLRSGTSSSVPFPLRLHLLTTFHTLILLISACLIPGTSICCGTYVLRDVCLTATLDHSTEVPCLERSPDTLNTSRPYRNRTSRRLFAAFIVTGDSAFLHVVDELV